MEDLTLISSEFEQEVLAAMAIPDDNEQEFLMRLRKRILDESASQRMPRQPFFARLAWGVALLVLLALLTVFIVVGPQRVLAAVRGWLGYIPGIGFVQNDTTLRVLAAPVEQERDGIVVTVEQVVADAQRTVLLYQVDGIQSKHRPGGEEEPSCLNSPYLRLPDGSKLIPSGGGGTGWPGGYQTRNIFPAIPVEAKQVTLVVPCLLDTRPDSAPENWELALHLQPAPPDFQPLPVIELPTQALKPSAQAEQETQSAGSPAPVPSANPHGIQFSLEKLVELEDGFLFQGTLSWQGTELFVRDFDRYLLQVTDAAGQQIPVEPVPQDASGNPAEEKHMTWAVRTEGKSYASLLTITLPAVQVSQAVDIHFDLDMGANPQPGQTWELNQDLNIAGRRVRLLTASLDQRGDGAYWLAFTFQADPQEGVEIYLWDPDNQSTMISGEGGSDPNGTMKQSFSYDYLPEGKRHIQINGISYRLDGPWTVSVDLPAVPTVPLAPTPSADLHGIQFQVEKLVELDDGYLLQGSLDWQSTEFELAYSNPEYFQVLDAAGLTVPIESVQSDSGIYDPYADKRRAWTIQTASKGYASPLTITLPVVGIDQQVEVPFEVDLGADPQVDQTWELNQTLDVAGRPVTIASVTLEATSVRGQEAYGLAFTVHVDPDQLGGVYLSDPDHARSILSNSGSSDLQGNFLLTLKYDHLPTGLHRILISDVKYGLSGPWIVSVDLPPTSAPAAPVPTQPAACLTPERLAQLQVASPASLPAGLGGRLLISGPAVEGVHFPTLYLMDLDGANKVTVGSGGWADLSPDGRQVVFAFSDGMHLYDLESGQNTLLPGVQENDYHPVWSPDGEWIAFVRSNDGIYIARPDGADLRKVSNTGVSTFLAGWLPDGKGLVVTSLGAEGSIVQTVDLETGAATDHFVIDNRKGGFVLPSPDGLRVAYSEKVFGQPAYGVFIANLDGSQKRLVASLGAISVTPSAWSPDGRWLLVTASEAMLDGSKETNYLVQPDTCEVFPLTWIEDGVVSWSKVVNE